MGPLRRTAKKVPEITVIFWVIKLFTTAMGEATSDYSVHTINPVIAVVLGFIAFVIALAIQLSATRYVPWRYWLAVVMVAVFGTMAADVLHVRFSVPYADSAALYGTVLAVVLIAWYLSERTLSIHSITTLRRELFYWATVSATFAVGTAAGDMMATTFHFGYLASALLFLGLIALPVFGSFVAHLNEVATFWFAYILTRPLGASVADWLGFPHQVGGEGVGHGVVALVTSAVIVVLVLGVSVHSRREDDDVLLATAPPLGFRQLSVSHPVSHVQPLGRLESN